MDNPLIPNLYVGYDTVVLEIQDRRFSFPISVWDAMMEYVKNYRQGKALDGVLITDRALPDFR